MKNNTIGFPFARYPAVRILLLFITGIIAAFYTSIQALNVYLIALFALFVVLFVIFERLTKLRFNNTYRYISLSIYSLFIVLAGYILCAHQQHKPLSFEEELFHTYSWKNVTVHGVIKDLKYNNGRYTTHLETLSYSTPDSLKVPASFVIRARIDSTLSLNVGDTLHVSGTVLPITGKRNPHDFDYKSYLESQSIFSQIGSVSITCYVPNIYASSYQKRISNRIEDLYSLSSSIAKALLIGDKSGIEQEDRQSFSRAGLSHLMAVSGLHVGFIILPLWFLLSYLWTYRYGKHLTLFIFIAILGLYASLTNFTPSVVRASITAILIIYSKLYFTSRDTVNLTAFAALILLMYNPLYLFDISFQLSFSAVFIILLILPIVQNLLPQKVKNRWYSSLLMVLIVSIVVQIGLFPIQAYYFKEVSLISPLSNVLFIPIIGILVPLAALSVILSFIIEPVASILAIPVDAGFSFLTHYSKYISQVDGSWIAISSIHYSVFLIWLLGLGFIAAIYRPRTRQHFLLLLCFMIFMTSALSAVKKLRSPELKVTVFDVGQGDAALIQTPNGKTFLIDTGRWTPSYNTGKSIILPHLRAEGISRLNGVFLTHPHSDHIGGVVDLIESIPVDTIYNSGFTYDSELYTSYISLAYEKGIPVKPISAGNHIRIDPSLLILAYGPTKTFESDDPNEHSLVLELMYGNTQFLFAGDAEKEAEEHLIKYYPDLLETDFLKVGHHGSRTSSTSSFLEKVAPDIAIISVGARNFFGHPHQETTELLQHYTSELELTSNDGALIYISDGERILKREWK